MKHIAYNYNTVSITYFTFIISMQIDVDIFYLDSSYKELT
jgi:hypothetical protein